MNKLYFSQVDSRWKNNPYPSPSLPNATIGTGGCGVCVASMIVSSFKDIVMPDKMAQIFMEKGFRVNGGTSNAAMDWIAENYGINHELKWKLDDAIDCLKRGGMVVALCSKGLFTTGGHFIVLAGMKNDDTIIVYDSYLYSNKFNAYGRAGKATVDGNKVYVSYANMKEYGAYHQLWCYYPYKTDAIDYNQNIHSQMKVCNVSTNLNVRQSPGGNIVGKLKNNDIVTVYEKIGGWARIGDNRWVSLSYLTSNLKPEGTLKKTRYVLGKYVTNVRTALNVRVSPVNGKVMKTYKNGTRFDTYEIRDNWARTPSGWVCLDYCKLVYRYNTQF